MPPIVYAIIALLGTFALGAVLYVGLVQPMQQKKRCAQVLPDIADSLGLTASRTIGDKLPELSGTMDGREVTVLPETAKTAPIRIELRAEIPGDSSAQSREAGAWLASQGVAEPGLSRLRDDEQVQAFFTRWGGRLQQLFVARGRLHVHLHGHGLLGYLDEAEALIRDAVGLAARLDGVLTGP